MGMVARGDVWWVNLDPAVGIEIKKTRPALVVSPNDLNNHLPRVIVAPLTSKGQRLGCRPSLEFQGKHCLILLDQVRCIDRSRLISKMGSIEDDIWLSVLLEMFS